MLQLGQPQPVPQQHLVGFPLRFLPLQQDTEDFEVSVFLFEEQPETGFIFCISFAFCEHPQAISNIYRYVYEYICMSVVE